MTELFLGANGNFYSVLLSILHHGTDTIPPRPALTECLDEVMASPYGKEMYVKYLKSITSFFITTQEVKDCEIEFLEAIGEATVELVKNKINSGEIKPDNAISTIKAKGFNKPLYHTGNLSKNIDYVVE